MPNTVSASRNVMRGSERRPITALFADIVGSTSIVERMDPEDWTQVVNEAFDRMTRTIRHYEGTVARLMGDAVLAFFGAPVAHEDDPERAVRCALDMIRSIDELGVRVLRDHAVKFGIRAGISTGPVFVGQVGTDLAHEYTAMGDAVNVAARMQAAARPGTVLITAATHRFVANVVDAVDLGPLEVKGKTEAIRAYEVTGMKADRASARGLAWTQSPMVGRDEQLGGLRSVYAVVRAGQGRMVSILGEPGIGKSRLLAEFRAEAERSDPAPLWVEGRCLSIGRSLPYHLVLDLVRSLIGVGPGAGDSEIQGALERTLREALGDEWVDAYAYLAQLLSLSLEPEMAARVAGMEMETVKRYVASIHRLLQATTATRPVVLVCEDLHWADPSSVNVLAQLLPLANEMPLLCIATSRTDRTAPGWRLISEVRDIFGDALTELRLAPLSGEQSRELVANLLEIESLPAKVRDFILSKAEGNPFFVEEVIRMLIERRVLLRKGELWVATDAVSDVEIPDNLQALLLARIDQLPQSARRTLRVASVIGRQFGLTVLERILEPAEGS
ncbi:MAG: AAA family ATPase [Chloroflexota bacterium]|nr:AAA family ATPase [Chloroflexota bacterium]